jgi:hypothetical protein
MEDLYHDILKKKLQFEGELNERDFLICKSCFWCASLLNTRYRFFNECPSCMNSELESMPISFDETYTFDYNPSQGVSLGFRKL